MKIYSFYRNTVVIEDKKHNLYLQVNDTIVCGIMQDGGVKKFSDNYLPITILIIMEFLKGNGYPAFNVDEWKNTRLWKNNIKSL